MDIIFLFNNKQKFLTKANQISQILKHCGIKKNKYPIS